ncbi:MAG: replication endonuclease [Ramlibacter sp.]|nr:replication endonuclease [Ramlibacter sp.]
MSKRREAPDWSSVDRQRLRVAERNAARELPASWLPIVKAEADSQTVRYGSGVLRDRVAAREVWMHWMAEYGGAQHADLSDAQIKAEARRHASDAKDLDAGLLAGGMTGWPEWARIDAFCVAREVVAPSPMLGLAGCAARVQCQYWWRRALRKMIARKCERGALSLGIVSKPAGQPYASNSAVFRRLDQNARNTDAMRHTFMENDEGARASLLDLAQRSTANRAIRRGELMTRIRGCEETADAQGHRGLFVTLTCPSRFHSTLRTGERNPKHDGSTPRDAQLWLRRQWARARAALHRAGYVVYGFRVAEPHHDGCTHWHALIWSPVNVWRVARILKRYWLQLEGDEPGARKYRTAFKVMDKGGAAGYIAKYVAKNIDDFEVGEHLDEYSDVPIQGDVFEGVDIRPSHRVEAWASTWGIRQFQAIGQPPVTVWRELRRIPESVARSFGGIGSPLFKAWHAAQRVGGVLASWSRYVAAQGGMGCGRTARLALAVDRRRIAGLYGEAERACPVGVLFVGRVAHSERQLWRRVEGGAGSSGLVPAPPRTRVNNCTHNRRGLGAGTEAVAALRRFGLLPVSSDGPMRRAARWFEPFGG